MRICIYGASSTKISDEYIKAVEILGEKLAKKGHSLVFGAGASGVMGASARGFKKGGGYIVGVAPRFFNADGILYDRCDELIRTETMRERKQILEDSSDCFIVAPGGIGTFDEFFEILTLKQLGRHSKAIVVYNALGYYDKLEEFMRHSLVENFITDKTTGLYEVISDDNKIIEYIENYVGELLSIEQTKHV